ncbi:hypothetical protein ACFQFR_02330 [Streptomyces goshikiensis]
MTCPGGIEGRHQDRTDDAVGPVGEQPLVQQQPPRRAPLHPVGAEQSLQQPALAAAGLFCRHLLGVHLRRDAPGGPFDGGGLGVGQPPVRGDHHEDAQQVAALA